MPINLGNVTAGRDVNVTETTTSTIINPIEIQEKVISLVKEGKTEEAESVLQSLPKDILDVVIAGLHSPLAALGVAIKKIKDKVELY